MGQSKIGQKIGLVMEAIDAIVKDKTNAFHKYDYVSDEAIVKALRGELIKNSLIVIPNQQSCTVAGDITTIAVQYTIMDTESGESFTATVYGQGQDKGDKGAYKAATGAEKYFLLKTFLIPTSDDPENESVAKQAPQPYQKANAATPKPATSVTPATTQGGWIKITPKRIMDKVSKKGTAFWSVLDQTDTWYRTFSATVRKALQIGVEVTVDIEQSSFGPNIIQVVQNEGLPQEPAEMIEPDESPV